MGVKSIFFNPKPAQFSSQTDNRSETTPARCGGASILELSDINENLQGLIETSGRVTRLGHQAGKAFSSKAGASEHVMTGLGLLTHGIGFITGPKGIKDRVTELKDAKRIKDSEGIGLAVSNLGARTAVFSASTLALLGFGAQFITEIAPGLPVFSICGNVFTGIGSSLGVGISAYRLAQLVKFRVDLNRLDRQILQDKSGLFAQEALLKLKSMLFLSKDEEAAIAGKIEKKHPEKSDEEKEALFEKERFHLLAAKEKYFQRRCSKKSVRLILTQADLLLSELKNLETRQQAIEKTTGLLSSIRRENTKKTALYATAFIVSALAFIAFIAGTVASAGVLPFALFAASISIGLLTMLVQCIAKRVSPSS